MSYSEFILEHCAQHCRSNDVVTLMTWQLHTCSLIRFSQLFIWFDHNDLFNLQITATGATKPVCYPHHSTSPLCFSVTKCSHCALQPQSLSQSTSVTPMEAVAASECVTLHNTDGCTGKCLNTYL